MHVIYIISASSLQAHIFDSSEASAAVHNPTAATATAATAFTPCNVAAHESEYVYVSFEVLHQMSCIESSFTDL